MKKNLMKKIKYRMCLVSNDSSLYIAKKVIIFKVTHVILSDFKSFQVILTKYMFHITCIIHITYKTHVTY